MRPTSHHQRHKFDICSVKEKFEYNARANTFLQNSRTGTSLMEAAKQAAVEEMPRIRAKGNRPGISDEIAGLIEQRGQALLERDVETVQYYNKEIQKRKKAERRQQVLQSVDKDLDLRDRWMGIRNLKKGYQSLS